MWSQERIHPHEVEEANTCDVFVDLSLASGNPGSLHGAYLAVILALGMASCPSWRHVPGISLVLSDAHE